MAGNSRVSLPQEFYDKTSDSLLVQPQPQFLYAKMWLGGMYAGLGADVTFGITGRETPSNGAAYAQFSSDVLQLATDLPSQIVAAKVDFKGAPGNTIRFNRPSYASTTYTAASRVVPSGASISTTAIASSSEQTSLTLFRYGGPYDSANSRVAPIAIESFDATMGVHSQPMIAANSCKQDFNKWLDAVQVTLCDGGANTVYPQGMTAANDATVAEMFAFSFDQIARLHQKATELNLPTLPDGNRVLVLHPTQFRQLSTDVRYQTSGQFFPEFNVLFGGSYKKTVHGCHIFESTTLNSTANSSSVSVYTGHLIAPGALLAGMGRPPRIASSSDDNYGETVKIVWLADLAFALADSRFVVKAVSA